jgi:hypothetical protein
LAAREGGKIRIVKGDKAVDKMSVVGKKVGDVVVIVLLGRISREIY